MTDKSRKDFEKFHTEQCIKIGMGPDDIACEFDLNSDGEYTWWGARDAWEYWKMAQSKAGVSIVEAIYETEHGGLAVVDRNHKEGRALSAPLPAQEPVAWEVDVRGYTKLLYKTQDAADDSARHYGEERGCEVSVMPLFAAAPSAEQSDSVVVPRKALADFIEYSVHGSYGCDAKWLTDKQTLVASLHANPVYYVTEQPNAAVMPCGTAVSNVYEAYEAGKKAAKQPGTVKVSRELLDRLLANLEILNARPRSMCRDCADRDGICDSGLDCNIAGLVSSGRHLLDGGEA